MINKMENCYGIKKIEMDNNAEFKRVNLIFAPNGTFKTSFYNSLSMYASGEIENIKDRFTDISGEIDLSFYGNKLKKDEIILFSKGLVDEIDRMESLKLLTNPKVMNDFNYLSDFLQKFKDVDVLDSELNKYDYLISLNEIIQTKSYQDFKKEFETLRSKEKGDFSKLKYNDFKKGELFDETTQSNILKIQSLERKMLDIVKDNFGVKDIDSSSSFIEKLYNAGHYIVIKQLDGQYRTLYTYEDFINLYNLEVEKIKNYIESDNDEYKNILKTLDNNKNNRAIKKAFTNNINALSLFSNNEKFFQCYFIEQELRSIDFELVNQSYKNLENYSEIINASDFKETVEQFNSRFYDYITIKIEDEINTDLNIKLQKVIVTLYDTSLSGEQISNYASTGEKGALAMFILMHKIIKNQEEKKLVIIDDDLEVFDYAFKHSFIEYLNDICMDSCVNVIILTHNYDFLRSFYSKISIDERNDNVSLLVAYKSENQNIKITKIKTFEQLKLKNMHDNINEKNICSYIATKRNIVEIEKEEGNFNFLTSFLHYKPDTVSLEMSDIIEFVNNNSPNSEIKINEDMHSKKYIDFLYDRAEKICSDCVGSANLFLNEKVTLAIACRMKFEENFIGDEEFSQNQTRGIYDRLCDDDKKKYSEVNIILPDFIHLNAFAYEPLMDIKIDRLIKLYKKL